MVKVRSRFWQDEFFKRLTDAQRSDTILLRLSQRTVKECSAKIHRRSLCLEITKHPHITKYTVGPRAPIETSRDSPNLSVASHSSVSAVKMLEKNLYLLKNIMQVFSQHSSVYARLCCLYLTSLQ